MNRRDLIRMAGATAVLPWMRWIPQQPIRAFVWGSRTRNGPTNSYLHSAWWDSKKRILQSVNSWPYSIYLKRYTIAPWKRPLPLVDSQGRSITIAVAPGFPFKLEFDERDCVVYYHWIPFVVGDSKGVSVRQWSGPHPIAQVRTFPSTLL